MRPLIGIFANAALMMGSMRFLVASIVVWATPQAAPMASSQAAVPSWPTGAEPTTLRPACSNSRTTAV
jgi:hypothetical protein